VLAVQSWKSVTVKVYVPGPLVNVPIPPVYGAVPPLAVTVTVVVVPLQGIAGAVAVATNCVGCVITIVAIALQPAASETVNLHVPAPLVNVPVPLYGAVPPDAVTVTVVVPPKQLIGEPAVAEAASVDAVTIA